ncbi:hypothetical protein STTU_1016 [Streptomyces sp. Tu6071]|nr:hypothetical protein STTU_1016 [Streptomyces sp. Tu6071]
MSGRQWSHTSTPSASAPNVWSRVIPRERFPIDGDDDARHVEAP